MVLCARWQVGGADQWGNITVGTDTVKRSLERGLADTKKPATGDREGAPPALVVRQCNPPVHRES